MAKTIKTMEQFSEFVGLSRPTVSRYFRDPDSVRKRTRDKIEAALKKSGFQPNVFAVNLNRKHSNIIGVIIPNPVDPFYMELTRRVDSLAQKAGYLAFTLSSDGKPDMEDRAVRTFRSLNVAGAVIAPLGMRSHHAVLRELGQRIPLVYVDSPLDETSAFVGTDNRQSFGLMVDYLCRSGPPPCYFDMPQVNANAVTRRAAYIEAMERLGQQPEVLPIEDADTWDFEKFAFDRACRLFDEPERLPSGTILCANDRIAFGVISAAQQKGLKVGHGEGFDLRVAGHDNHPLSRYACPPITTVAQNYDEIGRLSIELMLQKIAERQGEPAGVIPERILLSAAIMLRSSA